MEKTPSFKANRNLNRWYDFGLGEGGSLIDFGILYHRYTVAELLRKVNGDGLLQKPVSRLAEGINRKEKESKTTVLRERELASFSLVRYLENRRIPLHIAELFCKEIDYRIGERNRCGIGFKNDAGGYEIRSPFSKISSSPKGITTVRNGADEVRVFEGFFDFLSALVMDSKTLYGQSDYLVLNSVSLFEKARPFLEQHQSIRLYLDRDAAGQKCTELALSLSGKYRDESLLYAGYKDVNDWLVYTADRVK
ncbi:MAG: toprim domain-containing protein [Cytophagales bacterium]|nr:toprim domain-containing protein [Cytophagales bacterium]